jgi:hypothetical protein
MKFFIVTIVKTSNLTRLRVFDNRMLRRIFGLQRGEVTAGWKSTA